MRICTRAVGVSVVSDSEVLFMFVTLDGEVTARNNSEGHKIVYSGKMETKIKEEI
jgi:hypothetical protein